MQSIGRARVSGSPASLLAGVRMGGQAPRVNRFLVLSQHCHPERVFRARRTPTKHILPQPSTPFYPNSRSFLCSRNESEGHAFTRAESRPPLYVFASLTAYRSRTRKKNPSNPQQIRMSSPSTLQNPPNPHPTNHFPPKNTWHSSYAPPRRIKVGEKIRRLPA